ncbi:hypothetical protein AAU61_18975 [Desulfocarbo indianensis]|nr:hypothetical protein AAU61_18975 [Desulfocarbo indianensis]
MEIKALLKYRHQEAPRLSFNPASKQLQGIKSADDDGKELLTILYQDGWPDLILSGKGCDAQIIMRAAAANGHWLAARRPSIPVSTHPKNGRFFVYIPVI